MDFLPRTQVVLQTRQSFADDGRLDLWMEDLGLEDRFEAVVHELVEYHDSGRAVVVVVVVDPIQQEEEVGRGRPEASESVFGRSVLYLYREGGNRM